MSLCLRCECEWGQEEWGKMGEFPEFCGSLGLCMSGREGEGVGYLNAVPNKQIEKKEKRIKSLEEEAKVIS